MSEKVFRALTREEAIARLLPVADTLILFHVHPDGDAVGSAFALRLMLEAMGSRAYCVCADEIPDRLRFLCDGIQSSVLPESIPSAWQISRIVSVDTASPNQLGSLYAYMGGKIDLMLDHHERGTPYADYFIMPHASAAGEVLFDLLTEMREQITPSAAIAFRLYAAISSDTGGFRFENCSAHTHRVAAQLLEQLSGQLPGQSTEAASINHRLFEVKSKQLMAVEAVGAQRMQFWADGRVGAVLFPYSLQKQLQVKEEHLETLVDVVRCTEGVEVAIAVRQPADAGRFRVSMRSSCETDVAEICATFGGGGHRKAAGCTIFADTAEQALDAVLQVLLPKLAKKDFAD